MYRTSSPRRHRVARERGVPYAARPDAQAAVAKIVEGLAELAAVDPAAEADEDLAGAVLGVGVAVSRLAAQEARLVREFDARRVYRQDACVRAAGWLRHKTTLGHGASNRRVNRAKLLEKMPALREAFEAGDVRVEHVDAILYRAVPSRRDAIAEHDQTLTDLARTAEPRHVAVAVQRIVDCIDRDGADEPRPCDVEHLRGVSLRDAFAGLGDLSGATTAVLSELLRRTYEVYGQPDPAETPDDKRRTPSQRFHDALQDALTVALDNHPGATIGGVKCHIGLFADLFTLLGADDLAAIKPRLASGKGITPDLARHIIAMTNPTMRAILGLGPWQPVSVGRVRTLPDSLRMASRLRYPTCAAPGCDVPAVFCDSDHNKEYCRGGETSLLNELPMCHPHNNLKHEDNWSVTFNTDTGEVTWTSADRRRVITLPPPDI